MTINSALHCYIKIINVYDRIKIFNSLIFFSSFLFLIFRHIQIHITMLYWCFHTPTHFTIIEYNPFATIIFDVAYIMSTIRITTNMTDKCFKFIFTRILFTICLATICFYHLINASTLTLNLFSTLA